MPVCIAGSKTDNDWKEDQKTFINSSEPAIWEQAFTDYFKTRLQLRYLDPIAVIQKHGNLQGEGFSIVAIQCSIVEFSESTLEGKSYKFCKRGKTVGTYEYSESSAIFKKFLTSHEPFSQQFKTPPDVANDFYINVRCAIIHEARTKGGWKTHAKDPTGQQFVIDGAKKIVYRDDFQEALLQFADNYGKQLQSDANYQKAFIRKFDSLAEK